MHDGAQQSRRLWSPQQEDSQPTGMSQTDLITEVSVKCRECRNVSVVCTVQYIG